MPALGNARKQAQMAHCLANHKTLALAWTLYNGDNNGYFVGSDAWAINPNSANASDYWCDAPLRANGTPILWGGGIPTVEDEYRGIRNGKLWRYVNNAESYHCTGDNRKLKNNNGGHRTYSLAGGLNGQWDAGFFTEITRESQLRRSAEKYVSIENAVYPDAGGGGQTWSMGSWVLHYPSRYLFDPMAAFHNAVTTLGFCDGHAETYRFADQRTIDWVVKGQAVPLPQHPNGGAVNPDVTWFLRGFACKQNP
jgi:hypothetical protein